MSDAENAKIHLPVHASLPCCIVKPVENVQEHWANVTGRAPVILKSRIVASVFSLEVVPSAPDGEREDKHDDPCQLCSRRSPDVGEVQCKTEEESTEHLSEPVQCVVQSSSTHSKTC